MRTVCNAIEVLQGKRGFADFKRGTMLSSAPNERPIVGYAVRGLIPSRSALACMLSSRHKTHRSFTQLYRIGLVIHAGLQSIAS